MNTAEREARRQEACRRFLNGGLSQRAFCEENGIALSTLGYWLRKERERSHRKPAGTMVPVGKVETAVLGKTLRIRCAGSVTVELDLPVAEGDLQTVIRAVAAL